MSITTPVSSLRSGRPETSTPRNGSVVLWTFLESLVDKGQGVKYLLVWNRVACHLTSPRGTVTGSLGPGSEKGDTVR